MEGFSFVNNYAYFPPGTADIYHDDAVSVRGGRIIGNYMRDGGTSKTAVTVGRGVGWMLMGNYLFQWLKGFDLSSAYCVNPLVMGNVFNAVTTPIISVGGAGPWEISRNLGWVTEADVLSATFAIDSLGVKTITIAHGLATAPAKEDCAVTVEENTAVDDWAYDLLKVVSTDATNVAVKIHVSTASGMGGATAKIGLKVGKP